ncbi:MAG: hypothetical protein WDZ76_10445 [Pseudohongiellaceae bacterium]
MRVILRPGAMSLALLLAVGSERTIEAAEESSSLRTEWGHPDLQGVWNFSSEIPLQRPERYGEREFLTREEIQEVQTRMAERAAEAETAPDPDAANRGAPSTDERFVFGYDMFWYEMASIGDTVRTSQVVYPPNGRFPPLIPDAPVQSGGLGDDVPGERPVRYGVGGISKDGPEDRGLSERCIVGFNSGPPFSPSRYNNNVQIVQNRDHVVILTEMIHDARVVPLDGSPHIDDDIRLWTGDSRGRWEGDTLVVETRNFTDLVTSFGSYGTAYDKILTERFTRVDYDSLNYEWTLEDASTFTDRISAVIPMGKVAGQLYEYACHEGNYGMVNILRGARMQEVRTEETGAR